MSSGAVGQVEASRRQAGRITSPMALTDNLIYMWAVWSGFRSTAVIRHGFALVGPMPTLAQTLMGQWLVGPLPLVLPVMADTWSLDRLYCQDLVPGTAVDEDFAGSLTATGGSFADPLPGQDAAVITWYSDLIGRANRGRTFWPGLSLAQVQSGVLKPSAASAFGDYGEAMLDAFTPRIAPPYAQLGTISKQENGAPRGPVLIETTQFLVRTDYGIRRSRRTVS